MARTDREVYTIWWFPRGGRGVLVVAVVGAVAFLFNHMYMYIIYNYKITIGRGRGVLVRRVVVRSCGGRAGAVDGAGRTVPV